ncbi:MAG: CpXC domain-containing protein [Bacteroidales bacterium]
MSIPGESMAKCSKCGQSHKITIYKSINAATDPSLKDKVRDGSLFLWECPHCGTMNLARYETLYHDPAEKLMVWLLPEGDVSDKEAQAASLLDGYTLRKVKDVGSLIEKINISGCSLDDRAIEICKYVTKMELGGQEQDKSKGAAIMDAPFRFFKTEGADNELSFTFPLDGNMHTVKIGFNVYEDCQRIIKRNTSMEADPGFVSIDSAWVLGKLGQAGRD